jgi:hypothetical protein
VSTKHRTDAAELARAHIFAAGGLATVTDLARRWGVSRSRAHELARREDFPSPVATVSDGAVALYAVNEVDHWRGLTRPAGRPKRSTPDEAEQATMTRFVVVTRDNRLPVERFYTVEAAANYISRQEKFGDWTVLCQDGDRITASTPYRELTMHERRQLEKALYPTLFE